MTSDDLRRIFLGPTLFRLDTVLSPRLVPILYATGLASLLLWAVAHLFATFGSNFGNGLWGLLEIAVYGTLGLVGLRVLCEVLLVYFKTHEDAVDGVNMSEISSTLLDDVRDAIHDIADEEDDSYITPATDPAPEMDIDTSSPKVRRTARRSPSPRV